MATCPKCGKRVARRKDGRRKCAHCGFLPNNRNLQRNGEPMNPTTVIRLLGGIVEDKRTGTPNEDPTILPASAVGVWVEPDKAVKLVIPNGEEEFGEEASILIACYMLLVSSPTFRKELLGFLSSAEDAMHKLEKTH